MKHLLLFILIQYLSIKVYAQKNEQIIKFSFDTSKFSYPFYETDETISDNKILRATIRETSTNKEIADFLRINKYSYYYIQKDKSNIVIEEGKAVLEKTPYQKIKIPTFNNNGELNGYLNYNYYIFKKEGTWSEKLTDSTIRFGIYKKNLKDSIWNYSKSINNKISFLEKEILYKKGIAISEKSLNLLSKSLPEIIKELEGTWTVFSDYNPTDTIISFHKIKNDNGKYITIKFNKDMECKILARRHHKNTSQMYKWIVENGKINIYAESKSIFSIECFNKNYFVMTLKRN